MEGIFKIVCFVAILFQGLVSSAPAKKATPNPAQSPIVIHCDLRDRIREIINHLPYATGSLEQDVYSRYKTLVSVDEKIYLHNLHSHLPTKLWSASAQPNNQIQLLPGPIQSNQTVPQLLMNSSLAISCSICSLRKSKNQYKGLPNSSKVVKAVEHIQNEMKDLLSEIIVVGIALKPGTTYKTTCKTCQIHLTKGKRNRKQIALNLAKALERLHAELIIMRPNFFALRSATCPPTVHAVGHSG